MISPLALFLLLRLFAFSFAQSDEPGDEDIVAVPRRLLGSEDCTPWGEFTLFDVKYLNNQWAVHRLEKDYMQCLDEDLPGWKWESNECVKGGYAFPEAIVGKRPSDSGEGTYPELSNEIDNFDYLYVYYDATTSKYQGTFSTALQIWLTNCDRDDHDDCSDLELLIYLHVEDFPTAGPIGEYDSWYWDEERDTWFQVYV